MLFRGDNPWYEQDQRERLKNLLMVLVLFSMSVGGLAFLIYALIDFLPT